MKKLIVISIVLSLSITLTTTVFAQTGGQVFINPPYMDEITVYTSDELILATGWGACTRGLVKAWINASSYEWYLDGNPIPIAGDQDSYWGPIELSGFAPNCIAGPGTSWRSSWRYPIGSLPAGTYTIRLTALIDHKIIDGADYDGDGKPDFYEGGSYKVIVHVVEP